MSSIVNKVVEVGSLGLVKDVTGSEAAADAAKDAGRIQASAADAQAAEATRQFDITQEQFKPFREAGVGALGQQQALLGLSGEGEQQAAFQKFNGSPGQKFIRDRAQRNLTRKASVIGGLGGGNVRSALVEQGTGFAQQDFNNQFGRLGQLAGQGQAATTAVGQFGQQASSNIQNSIGNAGAARASGLLGQAQAGTQATNQLLQLGGQAAGAFLSDRRLKHHIVKIGQDAIGNIYRFRYLFSPVEHVGRMAQELLKTRPEAVTMHESGFLMVSAEYAPKVA